MAIITAALDLISSRMLELLAFRRELIQLRAVALGEDCVAGIAIIGLDRPLAIRSFVQTVVTPEAARPIFVADVIRIDFPTGLHLREEVVGINLLHRLDYRPNAQIARIPLGKDRGDGLPRLSLVGV